MLIDWFTVSAQIVNFLILVALLKHFLFGRILRTMEERERLIAAQFSEADIKTTEANRAIEAHRQKLLEFEEQRNKLLTQAKNEADALRKDYLEQAREEVGRVRLKWRESLEQEKIAFLQDLRRHTARQVFCIARSALKDLGHVSLEHHMTEVFLQQLRALSEEKWQDISKALENDTNHDIVVQTTFELPEETRQQLIQILRNHLPHQPPVNFTIAPELMGGIELKVPGYRIGWSFAHYLDTLESELSQALEEVPRATTEKPHSQYKGRQ